MASSPSRASSPDGLFSLVLYLASLLLAALATALLLGPVAYHRLVFRRGQKEERGDGIMSAINFRLDVTREPDRDRRCRRDSEGRQEAATIQLITIPDRERTAA